MGLTDGQRRCVETLDKPLVVAAGAGSGKTYTLTQRIAGAFEDRSGQGPFVTDIDQICAITFTKKAAGELKSRIKAELRARNRIDQALLVDEAWISTIHGMCARILRAHAIELGIDPAFTVAEGPKLEEYQRRAIDKVLAEAELEDSPRLDALFGEYKVRSYGPNDVSVETMLSSLVEAASSQAAGFGAFAMPGAVMPPAPAVGRAVQIVEGFFDEAQGMESKPARDTWLSHTGPLLEAARAVLAQGVDDYETAFRTIGPFKLAKNFGGKEFRERVAEARPELNELILEMHMGAVRPHLETLVQLGRRVLDELNAMKRADGALDNNDLLVLAARALEEHPGIAARYADKFRLVMVDEFQDTDQMQVDMIKRLAGEGACRLCTVGDAQQSIYRFRGADVSVYRRHLQHMRADWPGSVIELVDNFRSHGDVLAFVDCVFGKPDMFGGEFMSLAEKRDAGRIDKPFPSGRPRIVVQHTTHPSRGVKQSRAREVAAQRIADEFATLVEAGHGPGEMVILLGSLTKAGVYAQALRNKGIPCVVAGGSVFAAMPEAQMMEQLARVIANPLETQPLFNVLTSPLFALTAGDLLGVGGIDGFWRAAFDEDAPKDASPQLACALRVMRRTRADIGVLPVARIMGRVLADSGWLSRRQSEGAEGLASAANALKAMRMVDAIERSGAVGPASVARRFAGMLAGSKEAPGALSVSGGDSVRIMSIHSSKGLEFPIVAVGELDKRPSDGALVVSSMADKVFVSLGLGQTKSAAVDIDDGDKAALRSYVLGEVAGEDEIDRAAAEDAGAVHRRLALQARESAGEEEEAKRLLYVALTRAREALVISSFGNTSAKNPAGIPKNVLAGVFAVLDPTGEGFEAGRSLCDFGGSAPAVLEVVALEADEAHDAENPVEARYIAPVQAVQPGERESASTGSQAHDRPLFMVPAPEEAPTLLHETYKPAREGVFSYSSVSDASHEGDLLDRLAASFAVSVDEGVGEGAFEPAADPLMPAGSFASFDDGFWDFDITASYDEDRATDLGTAFHRLAQYAVIARKGKGPLAMPPADRVEALSRTCGLDGSQRARLAEALERWFGCDIARDMAGLAHLAAEVPFFVKVPMGGDSNGAYLEGEIDLLGFDESHARATVVDYKTGGHDDETADDLRCKHVLQASCYAYAIMLQGVQDVEAVFVRVERPRADDPAQPQCVRYRFSQEDIPVLAQVIAEAYGNML